ncbi:MAG: lactate utilization protein C [Betaproteobacteria bacterium]|nr:lactate utilization protein C [Betaproteobacteria bacterium]
MNARELILGRVCAALNRDAAADAAARRGVDAHLDARAVGPQPAVTDDLVETFMQCAAALSSTVERVASADEVPARVAAWLQAHGLPAQAVGWTGPAALDWAAAGIALEVRPPRADDLAGITGAFCAIADTGTLMLLSGADTPAAASLLPETHVAVVPRARLVAHMEDAWRLLRAEAGRLPRAVNFVSGPSRTADIEQTVTLGAHGPYRVHVVLVG